MTTGRVAGSSSGDGKDWRLEITLKILSALLPKSMHAGKGYSLIGGGDG